MTTTSRLNALTLVLALVAAPRLARAQQPAPPSAQPATAPAPGSPIAAKQRRTVEIRAQAPAPEVITVRPREVPQYTRRLLAPALLTYADTASAARASIVVPATASPEARAAAASDRRTRTP